MSEVHSATPPSCEAGTPALAPTFTQGKPLKLPPRNDVDWVMVSIALELEIKRMHGIIKRAITCPEDSDAVAEILALDKE